MCIYLIVGTVWLHDRVLLLMLGAGVLHDGPSDWPSPTTELANRKEESAQ